MFTQKSSLGTPLDLATYSDISYVELHSRQLKLLDTLKNIKWDSIESEYVDSSGDESMESSDDS